MNEQTFTSISNTQGDSFGVGITQTKQGWIDILNSWQESDGFETRYKIEDWDDLEDFDFRGVVLQAN